jgi:hypothetical protein
MAIVGPVSHRPTTAAQLADAVDRSSFDKLRAQEDSEGFFERPNNVEVFFREGRAGQWKEILTPQQVARVVKDHGAQMKRFGYLPEQEQARSR